MNLEDIYHDLKEDQRLQGKAAHIEYETLMWQLQPYLKKDSCILDIGAATGVYSLPLAKQGYTVYAVEYLKHHLELLKSRIKEDMHITALQGDARSLPMLEGMQFDIILCLGPLYHLDEEGQQQCLTQLQRLLKPEGVAFCAFINDSAAFASEALSRNSDFLNSDEYDPMTFKLKDEPFVTVPFNAWTPLLTQQGFTIQKVFAQDGISELKAEHINLLDDQAYAEWLRYHLASCERQEMLGYSNHVVCVVQKKPQYPPLQPTKRLCFRKACMDDSAAIYALAKDPDVGYMCGWKPHESIEETRMILRDVLISDDNWVIYDRQDGTLYGFIGLNKDHHRQGDNAAMLGYWIGKPYWGQGIMAEAGKEVLRHGFQDRHLSLISVYHFPFNTQSKRVIEKLGFQYEGILHSAYRSAKQEMLDEVCYYLENPYQAR